jgi:hypothetical protein
MASGGMIYIPSLVTTGSGFRVILRALPQQFESLYYWHYWRKGFLMYAIEMTSGGMMYIQSFVNFWRGFQAILRLIRSNFNGCIVAVTEGRDLWRTPLKWTQMPYTRILASFMKIGTGVQAILRFCLNNFNGCNVGITGGSDLWSEPLRWAQVSRYTCQVS